MNSLTPFVKWPGGKTTELRTINKHLPLNIQRYFEPFVGGGAVLFSLSSKNVNEYIVNDISNELVMLYKYIKNNNSIFHQYLTVIRENWLKLEKVVGKHEKELKKLYDNFRDGKINKHELNNSFEAFLYNNAQEFNGMLSVDENPHIKHFRTELLVSLSRKFKRMKQLEKELGYLPDEDYIKNIETGFKSAFYTHYRYIYNNKKTLNISDEYIIAIFYFIREYCYSSMFRFNKSGGFNVPYGGMNYNRKDFSKKLEYIKSNNLIEFMSKVTVDNVDFEKFMKKYKFNKNDFIFLDPPYDSEFSAYDKNEFVKKDQIRLRDILLETKANFMLVIKNTEFIADLYKNKRFKIKGFDKKYTVSFMNRNDRNVKHLIITNY